MSGVDDLGRRIAQLEARRSLAEQRARTRAQKQATRMRIILGGELLRQWGGSIEAMPEHFRRELDEHLIRADDRALVGLGSQLPRGAKEEK